MNSVRFVQQFKPMELEYSESHRLEAKIARAFHENIVLKLWLWGFHHHSHHGSQHGPHLGSHFHLWKWVDADGATRIAEHQEEDSQDNDSEGK